MDWSQLILEDGTFYYLNRKTRQVKWEPPAGFDPPKPPKRKEQKMKGIAPSSAKEDVPKVDSIVAEANPVSYVREFDFYETNDPRFYLHKPSGYYYEIDTGKYLEWDQDTESYLPIGHKNRKPVKVGAEQGRLLVQTSDHFPIGSILPLQGDSVQFGRDSMDGRLQFKDLQVSRYHCVLFYRERRGYYYISDCASTHGTFVNENRLSATKQASAAYRLNHLDRISIGSTMFVFHQHNGGECEKCKLSTHSLLSLGPTKEVMDEEKPKRMSKRKRLEMARLEEIERIKLAYGLGDEEEDEEAEKRRRQFKAEASHIIKSASAPKLITEEVKKQIPLDHTNKGKQLLEKMGWTYGTGLGSSRDGRVDPLTPATQKGKKGLGSLRNSQNTQNERR
jgi:pSer/pThr/pTyr-binding forkhead associated (FHA) protein